MKLMNAPRRADGRVFRSTPELRALWREVRMARTPATRDKRIEAFIRTAVRVAEGLPLCVGCAAEAVEVGEDLCRACLGLPPDKEYNKHFAVHSAGLGPSRALFHALRVLLRRLDNLVFFDVNVPYEFNVKSQETRLEKLLKAFPTSDLTPRKKVVKRKRTAK